MVKAIQAYLNLAWNFVINSLFRFLAPPERAADKFLEYYQEDKIITLGSADKGLFFAASHCIHCGLCDAVCPKLAYPSRMATTSIRSTLSYSYINFIDQAYCVQCGRCEQSCPKQVPLRRIAEFIMEPSRRF